MLFSDLASEILLEVFRLCTSVSDVVNLSLTCRRLHALLPASRRISILFSAAEIEFGPVKDILQLVTLNSSTPAHIARHPPISYTLLRQVIAVGRIAQKWEVLYPMRKWRGERVADRRTLNAYECYCLRRAVYRFWLYSHAFHNSSYPRTFRVDYHSIIERTELLRRWTTEELLELEDLCQVVRCILDTRICPSNSTIQRRLPQYSPRSAPQILGDPGSRRHILFTGLPSHPSHATHHHQVGPQSFFAGNKLPPRPQDRDWHEEGWGDEIAQYYVVEDMMKLDPRQVVHLFEQTSCKRQVEEFIDGLGTYFLNNGQTLAQTLAWVLQSRGQDLEDLKDHIGNGTMGVAKNVT